MLTDLEIMLVPGELSQIVDSVFLTMVGLQVAAGDCWWSPGEECLTAAVYLSGEWNGALLVQCSPLQACRFAGRFLSMDAPERVDDIVRDVLGELANMIGGNLKCVLTQGIRISIPTVVDGGDHRLRLCHSEVRERLVFESVDGPFSVTVLMSQF